MHRKSKDITKKLLELNESGKVAGHNSNIQLIKYGVAFLYTNNELSKREIKETISFIITSKRIKYLGINLPKEVKDLHSQTCKTVMKETEEDTNGWKDTPD